MHFKQPGSKWPPPPWHLHEELFLGTMCSCFILVWALFLERCQDSPPNFWPACSTFFHKGLGTAVHAANTSLQWLNLRGGANSEQMATVSIYADRAVYGGACVCAKSLLHAVLPRNGVAVLWVVEERHVDSNEWCPVPREDLTSDYWHQAAWANKHRKGWVNKQCQPASTSGHGINAANNCHAFARDTSREVRLTDKATQTCHWLLFISVLICCF